MTAVIRADRYNYPLHLIGRAVLNTLKALWNNSPSAMTHHLVMQLWNTYNVY